MSTPETQEPQANQETKSQDPYYRSSYAIKRELEPGLKQVTRGLRLSLAELLSMFAEDPAASVAALTERAKAYRVKHALPERADSNTRAARKKVSELLKNADPETLKRMLAVAEGGETPNQG
jgi:hypothetical protein